MALKPFSDPWNTDDCQNAYDELMVKIAMSSYAEIEGRRLMEENEIYKELPEFQLSDETFRKIEKLLDKATRKLGFRTFGKTAYQLTSRVAVVFLIVFIGFSTTVMVNADFRGVIYDLLISSDERYIEIQPADNSESFVDYSVYDWDGAYAPTMIPTGYKLGPVESMELYHLVTYIRKDGKVIEFEQFQIDPSTATRVDTEDSELSQSIMINDSIGHLVVKGEWITIYWTISDTLLSVSTDDSKETATEVARSIMLIH